MHNTTHKKQPPFRLVLIMALLLSLSVQPLVAVAATKQTVVVNKDNSNITITNSQTLAYEIDLLPEGGTVSITLPSNSKYTIPPTTINKGTTADSLLAAFTVSGRTLTVKYTPNLTGKTGTTNGRTWSTNVITTNGKIFSFTFVQKKSVVFETTTGTSFPYFPIKYNQQTKVATCLKSMRDAFDLAGWEEKKEGAALALTAVQNYWGKPYALYDCTEVVRYSINTMLTGSPNKTTDASILSEHKDSNKKPYLNYSLSALNKNALFSATQAQKVSSSAHYLWSQITKTNVATPLVESNGITNKTNFTTKQSELHTPGVLLFWYTPSKNCIGHTAIYLFHYNGKPYLIEASSSYNKDGGKVGASGATCVRQIQNFSGQIFYGAYDIFK